MHAYSAMSFQFSKYFWVPSHVSCHKWNHQINTPFTIHKNGHCKKIPGYRNRNWYMFTDVRISFIEHFPINWTHEYLPLFGRPSHIGLQLHRSHSDVSWRVIIKTLFTFVSRRYSDSNRLWLRSEHNLDNDTMMCSSCSNLYVYVLLCTRTCATCVYLCELLLVGLMRQVWEITFWLFFFLICLQSRFM